MRITTNSTRDSHPRAVDVKIARAVIGGGGGGRANPHPEGSVGGAQFLRPTQLHTPITTKTPTRPECTTKTTKATSTTTWTSSMTTTPSALRPASLPTQSSLLSHTHLFSFIAQCALSSVAEEVQFAHASARPAEHRAWPILAEHALALWAALRHPAAARF